MGEVYGAFMKIKYRPHRRASPLWGAQLRLDRSGRLLPCPDVPVSGRWRRGRGRCASCQALLQLPHGGALLHRGQRHRRSEVATLRWADVDLSDGGNVIVTLRRSADGAEERADVRRLFDSCAAAGLEGRRTAHSGRVGLAVDLTARGASTRAVQFAGGWKGPAMVFPYGAINGPTTLVDTEPACRGAHTAARRRPHVPAVAVVAGAGCRVPARVPVVGGVDPPRRHVCRDCGPARRCGLDASRCQGRARAYAVVRRTRRRGDAGRGLAWCARLRGVCACCARYATSWSPASSRSCSWMRLSRSKMARLLWPVRSKAIRSGTLARIRLRAAVARGGLRPMGGRSHAARAPAPRTPTATLGEPDERFASGSGVAAPRTRGRVGPVEQIHWERAQESLQVPDRLSARLRERSSAFRANGLVGAFDAECLELQDICQQRESCRGGPQGLFHCWRRGRVARHDDLCVSNSQFSRENPPHLCGVSPMWTT